MARSVHLQAPGAATPHHATPYCPVLICVSRKGPVITLLGNRLDRFVGPLFRGGWENWEQGVHEVAPRRAYTIVGFTLEGTLDSEVVVPFIATVLATSPSMAAHLTSTQHPGLAVISVFAGERHDILHQDHSREPVEPMQLPVVQPS